MKPKEMNSAASSACSRRDFIKGSVGAMALASGFAYAVDTTPRKVRMAVVGGGFGLSFLWNKHPDCVVTAVSDLRPDRREKLSKEFQCSNVYNSLEELVHDPNVDAVAIFTDGPLHTQHALECFKNGKHVISAVPAVWGSVEQAERLLEAQKSSGLKYMMAETSYYQDYTMSARKFYRDGDFGDITYCESQYLHDGLESLFFYEGKRTWRYGAAPMHYPTHNTAHLIGITGERLTNVVCTGWGDDDPILKDNAYNNPFWNETAMFTTNKGNSFRVRVWWKSPTADGVRGEWYGTKMSFYGPQANGSGPDVFRRTGTVGKDSAGFAHNVTKQEKYEQPQWFQTELPEPLRIDTGHEGSHQFIVKEFVDAIVEDRNPAVDIYESLAYTVPGVIAHESALKGGEPMKIPQFHPPAPAPSST